MTYRPMRSGIVAIMSAELSGDAPVLDTQADIDQTAIEWLPIQSSMYVQLSVLIREGKVRVEPRWLDDGRILELSLVRND